MFQPDLLKGKRILVTGGGTGLGRSMAHRYLELGANVIICGRREDVLKETAAELGKKTGGEIETVGCDVRIPDAITVQELANRMAEKGADLVKALFKMGMMVTVNQTIDQDTAELLVEEFGHNVQRVSESDVDIDTTEDVDAPETLKPRPPVVAIAPQILNMEGLAKRFGRNGPGAGGAAPDNREGEVSRSGRCGGPSAGRDHHACRAGRASARGRPSARPRGRCRAPRTWEGYRPARRRGLLLRR